MKNLFVPSSCCIERSAYFHSSVKFGENVQIGHNVVIDENVVIDAEVFIGHNVIIRSEARIGAGSVIGHNCVIECGVIIGDRVRIQPLVFLAPETCLGNDVFVGPGVQFLNDKRILSHGRPGGGRQCWNAPMVHRAARIGGAAIIGPMVIIGENAMIGAGSLVLRDVPAGKLWYGLPSMAKSVVPSEELI